MTLSSHTENIFDNQVVSIYLHLHLHLFSHLWVDEGAGVGADECHLGFLTYSNVKDHIGLSTCFSIEGKICINLNVHIGVYIYMLEQLVTVYFSSARSHNLLDSLSWTSSICLLVCLILFVKLLVYC